MVGNSAVQEVTAVMRESASLSRGLSATNYTCNGLGLNLGLPGERPATDRLRHGRALED